MPKKGYFGSKAERINELKNEHIRINIGNKL